MSKDPQVTTQYYGIDRGTGNYIEQLRRSQGASADVGNRVLQGDASAAATLMNPYNENLNPIWDQIRREAVSGVGDAASMAGAFGGSRQGVAEGVASGQVGMAQGAQRYQEFERVMRQALAQSQLGMGGLLAPLSTRTRTFAPPKTLWDYIQEGAGAGIALAGAL